MVVAFAGFVAVATIEAYRYVHSGGGVEIKRIVAGVRGKLFQSSEQRLSNALAAMGGPHVHALDFAASWNFRKFAKGNTADDILFDGSDPDAGAFGKIILLELGFRVAGDDAGGGVILFDDAKRCVQIRKPCLPNEITGNCSCGHAHSLRSRKTPKSSKLVTIVYR